MNIGIDARVLERRMSGIGRYLIDILKAIPSYTLVSNCTLFSMNKINFMEKINRANIFFKIINTGSSKIPSKLFSPFWLNFVLPGLIDKNKIDIFLSPNHLLPAKSLRCKSVIVIHDLHHLTNKRNHSYFYRTYVNFQLPYSIKNSDIIIAISESTKDDIIKHFKVSPDKIKVIYRTADKKFKPTIICDKEREDLKIKLKLPERYVLYVGMIESRKNILGILKTADILHSKKVDIKFVLVGKPGYGFNFIEEEINKRENIIYLNYVEEEDIVSIYNLALLFFFPSYYEGFGLPPLEAMQCGVPVLCSNIPPLKEVVGSNGFLRDPEDHNGFAEDIISLINNSELYSDMKQRSINQAKKFSPDESIAKLFEIFNDLKRNK